MAPAGNQNRLIFDYSKANMELVSKQQRSAPSPGQRVVLETQLLRDHRWSDLTVQMFQEPAYVAPIVLAQPSSIRLVLLLSGAMRMGLHSGGKAHNYTSTTGTVKLTTTFHQSYQMHWETLSPQPVRSAHLYLPNDLLLRTAEATGLNTTTIELQEGAGIPDPLLYQLGRELTIELDTPSAQQELFGETASLTLAVHLLRRHCVFTHAMPVHSGKLPAPSLRKVRDYIRANLDETIRLSELAALVHMSPYHFCRVFKLTTGLSPNQFVIHQRMERAIELLQQTLLSVGEIASMVGYQSHSHFTQLFTRHTGRLPTAFMSQHRSC